MKFGVEVSVFNSNWPSFYSCMPIVTPSMQHVVSGGSKMSKLPPEWFKDQCMSCAHPLGNSSNCRLFYCRWCSNVWWKCLVFVACQTQCSCRTLFSCAGHVSIRLTWNDTRHTCLTYSICVIAGLQDEGLENVQTFELDLLKPLFEQTSCTYRVSIEKRPCFQLCWILITFYNTWGLF